MVDRARLTPAVADTRRALHELLNQHELALAPGDLVLVACSGGADSMALAAAAAFESQRKDRLGLRFGAVIVEHGLQAETKQVAEHTAGHLRAMGFDPVQVVSVKVAETGSTEAAARVARYTALDQALAEHKARYILLAHTLSDQAETVLLGLARGSGARSLSGMAPVNGNYLRPYLELERATTEQACRDQNIEFWNDPHNRDTTFSRVRVRMNVLPVLERELGPGIAQALARTADQAREDEQALAEAAAHVYDSLAITGGTTIKFAVEDLAWHPIAIRHRVFIHAVNQMQAPAISRAHIIEIDKLIDHWHGQKSLTIPGVRVERIDGQLVFKTTKTLKPGAC